MTALRRPTSTAITNVRVFRDGLMSEPTTVVVENGLIAERTIANADDERVDASGEYLLPGFIDTHAHVSAESHLRDCARWGVTTVLDMAARHFDATMALKKLDGATSLFTAGRPASGPDSMFVTKMGFDPSTALARPEEAARFIADRVSDGSDFIKIMVEDPHVPGAKPLAPEVIAAVVVEAHKAGLLTIAHVVSADTLRTAVRAGLDIVTHAALTSELGAEFEQELAERGTVIIPTLAMMQGVVKNIGGKPMFRVLSIVVKDLRMRYSFAEATVRSFVRAGNVVLVGTDSNDETGTPAQPPHGESLHDELERLVAAGLSPADALHGAGEFAARVFRLADRGAVRPGLRADLVLVGGDPTTTISATRDIRAVWIAGERTT
ncbi:amidohydrolase family protein [Agreia sp.]|uniref:amidohydrolase family protein n=1 Tax=Agreia sp. TaxID=1872416 RepID=UPI0035BBA7A7